MSMIAHLRQVTPADLAQFQAAPDSIRQFIHGKLLAGMPATLALEYFGQLVSYYQEAASRNNAMLLYID